MAIEREEQDRLLAEFQRNGGKIMPVPKGALRATVLKKEEKFDRRDHSRGFYLYVDCPGRDRKFGIISGAALVEGVNVGCTYDFHSVQPVTGEHFYSANNIIYRLNAHPIFVQGPERRPETEADPESSPSPSETL